MHTCSMIAVVILAVAPAAAQGAPTFVPAPHLVRFAAEGVPTLLDALPSSSIGRLLAEPETAAAFAAGLARYRTMAEQRLELIAATIQNPPPDLDPWVQAQLATQIGWRAAHGIELGDVQRLELLALAAPPDEPMPRLTMTLAPTPKAEGRCATHFQRCVRELQAGSLWQHDARSRFAGQPIDSFSPATPAPEDAPGRGRTDAWFLHLPGVFAFGTGSAETCGAYAPAPARPPAQLLVEMDTAAYVAMFAAEMGGTPPEFAAIGLGNLRLLRWRLRFAQGRVLDELEAVATDHPTGLIGALLGGSAAPPPQRVPEPALAQLRCSVDVRLLVEAIEGFAGEALPGALRDAMTKAFTGGLSLGVGAPPRGGVEPRVCVSLGIRDDAALESLLAAVAAAGTTKNVTYDGVACTVLTLPDMPAAFQPTWCRRDGALHVTNSGLGMRAFLRAQGAEPLALDGDEAPIADGPGDLVPHFDLRWDERALYAAFHQHWLPLLAMLPTGDSPPLLRSTEMPSPDAVAPLLGKGRGVLRRDGSTFVLQQLAPLGGLHTAALAMLWGPLLSGGFHHDYGIDVLALAHARARLETAWAALEAFRQQHGRWPKDLPELIADRRLPADALLLPGDPFAEDVPMPGGAPRRSSFRYFAPPVEAVINGEAHRLLLVGIAPRRYQRPMLTDQGELPDCWGEESMRPIDAFGK
jgi:hypothetical protein